uniref:cytidylate kinase-like family protein n=1 Tax=Eubacterium cellulosolvens TaxID=29322 RepID=UPI00048165AA|nr:cytidylate kinase-like family protein [[Eubacterium] cellulosolvens]
MKTIISIGREFGSGGHLIGKKVAEKLGIPFYDKELLERAAKDSGLCKEIFENQDERPTNSFLYSLVMDTYSFGYSSNVMNDMPLNQKVFLAQFESIKKLAAEGPCVIIGRCADYALEEDPNLLSVFIHADIDTRVRRIANIYGLKANKARDRIKKNDKSRSSYYNYYTSKEWGSVDSYDLSINSAKYGIDGAAEMIIRAVMIKENGTEKSIVDTREE